MNGESHLGPKHFLWFIDLKELQIKYSTIKGLVGLFLIAHMFCHFECFECHQPLHASCSNDFMTSPKLLGPDSQSNMESIETCRTKVLQNVELGN